MKRAPAGLVFAAGLWPFFSARLGANASAGRAFRRRRGDGGAEGGVPGSAGSNAQGSSRRRSSGLGFTSASTTATSASTPATRSSRFQASVKAPADGTLSPPLLKALLAAAQKAREAAGFQVVSDPKTGAKIGAPLKLLSALRRRKARLRLERRRRPGRPLRASVRGDADPQDRLQGDQARRLLCRLRAGRAGQVLHPLRQEPDRELRQSAASPSPIRRRRPPRSTGLRSPSPIRSSRSRNPPGRRPQTPQRPPRQAAAPRRVPQPAATALVVAPGKALTALKADDCPNPTVAGKPVRIERADAATGLAMLAGDFASNGGAPRLGAPRRISSFSGFPGRALRQARPRLPAAKRGRS